MADELIPPLPPPPLPQAPQENGSTELPVPPWEEPFDEETKGEDLSALSPMAVLEKKNNFVPSSLSREELLKHASEAPTSTFILPENPSLPQPTPSPAPPSNSLKPVLPSPPVTPLPISPVKPSPEVISITPIRNSLPLPEPLTPPTPPLQPSPPIPPVGTLHLNKNFFPTPPDTTSVPNAAIPLPTSPKTSSSKVGIIAVLGLMIGLLFLGGSAYALALNGTRIPVLYSMVSGLPGDGQKLSQAALGVVRSKKTYQLGPETTIQVGVKASDQKPDIPNNTTSLQSLPGKLVSLKSTTKNALVTISNKGMVSQQQVSVDQGSAIPVSLQTAGGNFNTDWTAYFSTGVVNLVSFSGDDLKKTLLYPVLRPISLSNLLEAVQTEQDYQKISVDGKPVASYIYQLDPTKLAEVMPEGATSSGTAEIGYYWKTGLPAYAKLSGEVVYQKVTYTYESALKFEGFGQSFSDNTQAELSNLTNPTEVPTPVSALQFASYLGVAPGSLPSSLAGSDTGLLEGSPSGPVVAPTGEGVIQPEQSIILTPPVPASPASSEAKQRDIQRKKDLTDLQSALERYKTVHGSYPISKGLEQTVSSNTLIDSLIPDYMTKIPIDLLKNTYWYEYQSDGPTFSIRSVSEDGSDSEAKQGAVYYYFERTNK